MYKIIEKNSEEVLVKMDIKTFKAFTGDIEENILNYEFKFDEPINAKDLINM